EYYCWLHYSGAHWEF
nr:immunoglobulin light chain junction region [Macaca mulatta]